MAAKPIPTSVYVCFCVLGLTTGFFVGLSETPVVGGFVTGIISVLSGAALAVLIGKKKDEHPIPPASVTPLALSVIGFCVCSVVAGAAGIELRTRGISNLWTAPVALIEVSKIQGISDERIAALTVMQDTLKQRGMSNVKNNETLDAIIRANKLSPAKFDAESRTIIGYLAESRRLMNVLMNAGGAREPNYMVVELTKLAKSQEGDTKALLEDAIDLVRNVPDRRTAYAFIQRAEEAQYALYRLQEPETNLINTIIGMPATVQKDESFKRPSLAH